MRSLRWSEEPEELDRYQPVPQHCVAYWKRTFSHKEGQSGSNPEHATKIWPRWKFGSNPKEGMESSAGVWEVRILPIFILED